MGNKTLISYILILTGAVLQGVGMAIFLFPHHIPSGGAAGIAILLNHWFNLPLGLALWLANFVFLVFALRYFGYSWTMKTMIAVATTSLTVSFLSQHLLIPHVHLAIDILLGSLFFGIGVGILIRCGSSSGGMVIPSLMISTHFQFSPGKVMLVLNTFIFILTASVIDYKIIFYAFLCQAISTNIIDYIYKVKFPTSTFPSLGWRKK